MSQPVSFKKNITRGIPELITGKNMPFSLDGEKAVLGAVLLRDENMTLLVESLIPTDFYVQSHQYIFQGMLDIVNDSRRVDLITLQDVLEKKGVLAACGGMAYLISLQEDISAIGLVEQHAKMIKEKAVLRELIGSATSIIANCYAQDQKEIEIVLDEAEKTIFTISQKRASQSFVQLNIWLKKTFGHLSEIKSHNRGITGISSGYKKLDEMTSGFQKGDLIVLAARPSMGKTALALNITARAAQHGMSVGFFSLEMGGEQLSLRLLSGLSQVNHQHIRTATLTSDEWIQLTGAAGQLSELKIFIDDMPVQSIMDIRAKARKLMAEQKINFIVIDYLQLIHGHKKYENRHQEVSDISRSLKALAKELGIPILALSQLSRAVDARVDKRPMLSDLRESGAIEQDADLIMFIYRDVVYNPDTEHPSLAELIIGKQRNGPTGTVFLNFNKEHTQFEDYE